MVATQKYTPSPWLGIVSRLSLAVHLLAPLPALVQFLAVSRGCSGWFRAVLALAGLIAYLGYALFALMLHVEYFPERVGTAGRLLWLPILLMVLARFADPPGSLWLLAAGLLPLIGLLAAVLLLFSAGTHLAPRNAASPAGEGGVAWRAEGCSLWTDPDFAPMSRWVVLLAFLLPWLAVVVFAVSAAFRLLIHDAGAMTFWQKAVFPAWWAVSIAILCRHYTGLLIDLTADGRVFGPGRKAFE